MNRLLLIGTMLTIAACGGGGGGDGSNSSTNVGSAPPVPAPPTSSTPPPNNGSGLSSGGNLCFSGWDTYPCGQVIDIGGSGSNGNSGDRQPTPEAVLVSTEAFDVEPNSNRMEASITTFAYPQEAHEILGFHVNGSVNRANDPGDWFAFAVRNSGYYEFRLCEALTECSFESRDGRIDLADASLNVTTGRNGFMQDVDGARVAGNVQEFWIDAGITHYVLIAVPAPCNCPDEGNIGYRLQVLEAADDIEPAQPAPNAPILYDETTLSGFTVTIDWLPPTDYDDGMPLSDISGYVIYISNTPGGPYFEYELLTNPGLSSHTFNIPGFGEWYFIMTTINSIGIEGASSNEIRVEAIDVPDPATGGTI